MPPSVPRYIAAGRWRESQFVMIPVQLTHAGRRRIVADRIEVGSAASDRASCRPGQAAVDGNEELFQGDIDTLWIQRIDTDRQVVRGLPGFTAEKSWLQVGQA